MADSLERYREKRDFSKTQEPGGEVGKTKGFHYLIQKHDATRLHYDFRLELDGVLKSWAVTKGPSLDPADKRLAVEVEDHPVKYGAFEGTIPQGQYGGGTVMLWDEGTWEPVGDPREGLKKGDLKFILHGERLKGSWALVRMKPREGDRGRNNWLLIKHRDEDAVDGHGDVALEDNMTSVVSGRTMDEIAAHPGKVWKGGAAHRTSETHAPEPHPAPRKKKAPSSLSFVEPELATLSDDVPDGPEWVHEVKFDGYRTQAVIVGDVVQMISRNGLDWTDKFQALADRLAGLGVEDAILDGEIVALDDQNVSSFTALKKALSDGFSGDLQYYLFDLLHLNGEDVRALPLLKRKAMLKALLEGRDFANRVNYSEHFSSDSGFIGKVCRLGLEGLVSKRADAPYRSGRNRSWLKIKCHKRQEFVIGGFKPPTHAARGIGALMLGYYEEEKLVYAGKVGTGFDGVTSVALRRLLDKRLRQASAFDAVPREVEREATWVEPDIVCEVEFTEWTPDGRLRHPSFQGIREDKPARQIVREQEMDVKQAEKEAEMEVESKPRKAPKSKSGDAEVAGIRISHPDRIIYPDTDITKLDLVEYYHQVAEHILPFVAGRPLSMVRCPEGIGSECFFQRHLAHDQPHILDTGIKVKGRDEDYLMIEDEQGLVSLIQWGAIELHPWGCKADKPEQPDRMIFDLDPDPEVPWAHVVEAAAEVRDRLTELGLQSFLKTTGGKGLHVVVPMQRKYGWLTVKAFARALAESLAHDRSDRYIANMSKEKRKGKIFVDYLRNDLTATAVSAFSARARPGATVSTLLDWDELSADLKPADFTIETVPERLAKQKRDPWADFHGSRQVIRAEYLKALGIDAV
ncbi:MAG TPA: DNA ligase D [Asticcacaulis sp.]|nr:DNA ligase D [Asticcacaulis sp.]